MRATTTTVTLTATMFGRTIVTEHADEAEAMSRVVDIAIAQTCRIDRESGQLIPQVWIGERHVDDPRGQIGTYAIAAA